MSWNDFFVQMGQHLVYFEKPSPILSSPSSAWHLAVAHMPFYCTAPPTRRAGLEYHRIATIAAALVSLQNHFFTSTPHQSVQLDPTQLHAAERSGWQQEQNSHFRYFSPVQPARSASPNQPRGGGDEEGGRPAARARAAGDPMVF